MPRLRRRDWKSVGNKARRLRGKHTFCCGSSRIQAISIFVMFLSACCAAAIITADAASGKMSGIYWINKKNGCFYNRFSCFAGGYQNSGYLCFGERLLINSASKIIMLVPARHGQSMYQYPRLFISSPPPAVTNAVAPPGG